MSSDEFFFTMNEKRFLAPPDAGEKTAFGIPAEDCASRQQKKEEVIMNGKMTPRQRNLAESNLRLVYYILSKMNIRQTDEDTFGAGCLGLCKAAAAWKETGGTAFSTFACHLIRHEILDSLAREKNSRTADLPLETMEPFLCTSENGYRDVEDRDLVRRIFRNREHLFSSDELAVLRLLYRGFSAAGIAEQLGVSSATVYIIRKSAAEKIKKYFW